MPLVSLCWTCCLAIADAQVPASDPYTRGNPTQLTALGIVATGPFRLGEEHDSDAAAEAIGTPGLRWLETAHFRLGCNLADRDLPDTPDDRRRILAEYKALRLRLPAIPERPRRLDGWLRTHLHAQRLEALFARFQATCDVDAEWLREHPLRNGSGTGPHLGSDEKFVVLILEREGELARYLRTFCHCREDRPWMHRYRGTLNWLFATSAESCGGELADPVALDAHVTFFVAQNLLSSFVGDGKVPYWRREGLAHWFARQLAPQVVNVTDLAGDDRRSARESDWEPKVRARLAQKLLPPLAELVAWNSPEGRTLADHAAMWSFVDSLMRRPAPQLGSLFRSARTDPIGDLHAAAAVRRDWHERWLGTAFGGDLRAQEAAWHRHVLSRYARQ